MIHPTLMLRSSVVRAIGGYNESYPSKADHDFLLRMTEHGRGANLKDILLGYRVHHNALTARVHRVGHCYVEQAISEACRRRSITYPPQIVPRNPGLSFSDVYWGRGIRGLRQLGNLLFSSPAAFWGQLVLALSRSSKVAKLLRRRRMMVRVP